jgi:hypothetical protein
MKFSIHDKIVGKPVKVIPENPDDYPYYSCNGVKVGLGWGWTTIDTTWEDAFELITVDGYATSSALTSNNRKEEFFESRQLLMVDIDDGMEIQDLMEDTFYKGYGSGFYATPSFSAEKHKFRICFVLENAENDANRLRKINEGLLRIYKQADVSCKDPTRLFYGTPACVLRQITKNTVPLDVVNYLISIIDAEEAEAAAAALLTPKPDYEMTDARKAKILELLSTIFLGNYQQWRNVGWGMKAGGFTLADYQFVTARMMRQKTAQDAANVWNDGSVDGKVTMGSVIHLLKTHKGQDCMRDLNDDIKNDIRIEKQTKHARHYAEYSEKMDRVKWIREELKKVQK